MDEIFKALFKSLPEKTHYKFVLLLFILVITGFLLAAHERYFASARLSRIQKEAELLEQLQQLEIQNLNTNVSADFERLRNTLISNADRLLSEGHLTLEFIPARLLSANSLWKFFAGSFIWWGLAFVRFRKIITREGRDERYFFLTMAGIFGIFAIYVPPLFWPWFHMLILPWLIFAVLGLAAVTSFIVISHWRAAKETAVKNQCINNLRCVEGAVQQWTLEHSKPDQTSPTIDDLRPYLKNGVVPKCPLGGTYEVDITTKTPACSIPDHKLHQDSEQT